MLLVKPTEKGQGRQEIELFDVLTAYVVLPRREESQNLPLQGIGIDPKRNTAVQDNKRDIGYITVLD